MAHKVVPARYYVWNMCALVVLMTLTVIFGKFVNLSSNPNGINFAIALGIAIAKATCIVSIFMGVAFSTKLVRMFAVSGFAWLIILFLFIMTDYVNPSADWGTPYYDAINPGTSPLPGGQDFPVTGNQVLDIKSGLEYVPPHGASHDDEGHEGEEHTESHDEGAAGEDHGEAHDEAAQEDHAGDASEGDH